MGRLPTMDEMRERLLTTGTMAFLVAMVGVCLLDVVAWALNPDAPTVYTVDLGVAIAAFAAGLAARMLQRDGNYAQAARVFVVALAVRIALTVGLTAPVAYASLTPLYLVAIVVAQVLIGPMAGLLVGLGSLPMFGLAYAHLLTEEDVGAGVMQAALGNTLVYVTVGAFVQAMLTRSEGALRASNALLMENARARRELGESEEQFRALAENSPTAIIIEQDGHLVYANPRFTEMCRVNRADVYGLSVWDYFSEPDAARLRDQLAARKGASATGPDQVRLRLAGGQSFWCEMVVADAVYRQQAAVVANLMDVTARVLAAEEVRRERDFSKSIIESADAIIIVLDAEGQVIMLNPAGERLTGKTTEQMKGAPWYWFVMADDQWDDARRWFEGVKAAPGRGEMEGVWTGRSGAPSIIAWRYVCATDSQGRLTRLTGVGIDVTQQRLLEQQAMATERLRALGQVAGGVAHDLNNTLAGIMGPADLLLLDEEDPERQRELRTIVSAASRGAETVKRIQRFAKARTELEHEAFELSSLVDEMVSVLRPLWRDAANRRGVTIQMVNGVPHGLRVTGNVGEIGNALTNLLVNACEAMPAGGQVEITGHARGRVVVLEVADNGSGIAEEALEHIFEPFFSTKGPESNSGLGLAVIRGIILRHGGTIEVNSKLGLGTRFVISLPAAPAAPTKEEA